MLEALCFKYGLTIREARTHLTSLKRDTKISLRDHTTEVKRLVEAAYVNLPQTYKQKIILDLFCNSINQAYLQRHLLTVKPQSVSEAVKAGNGYLQIKPNSN